tara:strand:+ start:6915 stop:7310 length:396 start_codon:yes stop_codon:yes gene_type:complete
MATVNLINEEDAEGKVKEVFKDISETRKGASINNIWKALANDPELLETTWNRLKVVMGPGALDPLVKELIYIAVSVVNGCEYCIHSHTATARKKGMTEEMRGELLSVIAMASQTNALAHAYQIEVDESFKK